MTYSMALLTPPRKSTGVAEATRTVSMRFTRRNNEEVAAELMARMGPMDKYDDPVIGNPNSTVTEVRESIRSAPA